jgi:hypothetical protein
VTAGGGALGSDGTGAVKGVVEFGSMVVEDEDESSEEDYGDDDFDDDDDDDDDEGEGAGGETGAKGAVGSKAAAEGRRARLAYDSDDGAVETSFDD